MRQLDSTNLPQPPDSKICQAKQRQGSSCRRDSCPSLLLVLLGLLLCSSAVQAAHVHASKQMRDHIHQVSVSLPSSFLWCKQWVVLPDRLCVCTAPNIHSAKEPLISSSHHPPVTPLPPWPPWAAGLLCAVGIPVIGRSGLFGGCSRPPACVMGAGHWTEHQPDSGSNAAAAGANHS